MSVGLNVHGASPADLLQEPAAERDGRFGSGHCARDVANTVALEKEAGRHVSIFVDNLRSVSAINERFHSPGMMLVERTRY